MACDWNRIPLGRTGLRVTPLGLSSGYGIAEHDVDRAIERGIDYLYWSSPRRDGFGRAVARAARRKREELVLVVQSYARAGWWMRWSLERALRQLGTDHADLLLLGWWNAVPPPRILDAARQLIEKGKARHVMISCHHRPSFEAMAREVGVDALMVRYNAAHPGAETEVFPHLAPRDQGPAARPGVVSYTATRWGGLLNPALLPPGEPAPRASDCYRFALTHPDVDVTLCGPKDRSQLDEALAALDRGPMTPDELAWMKRVGKAVRAAAPKQSGNAPVMWLDRLLGAGEPITPSEK
jgi:aryl-alcohol dehydrogenase-like predicted oxidoreductase